MSSRRPRCPRTPASRHGCASRRPATSSPTSRATSRRPASTAGTEAYRVVEAIPLDPVNAANDAAALEPVRALVSPEAWATAFEQGRSEDMFDLLRQMAAVPVPPSGSDQS